MGGASGLQSKGRDEVLAGANLLLVGDELVQFRAAEFSDASTVRLTGLLRRRFGTGNAVLGVARGSWIAKVGPSSLPALALSPDAIGREIILLASGRGDPKGGTEAIHKVEGRGFAPLAPVHFHCERLPDQSIRSSWISRHRELWAWAAGVDPALPNFIWRFDGDDGAKREIRVNLPSISLTAADQIAMFGGLFGSGSASVEAVGEGPSELRRSGPVRI
ncbi:MAG: phage tail baseplate protein [Sandaracinobacteroides sp.]